MFFSRNGARFFARDNELQESEGGDTPESYFEGSCNFHSPNAFLRSLGDEAQESSHQMSNGELNTGSSFPITEPENAAIEMINGLWHQETFVYPREADEQLSGQNSEVSPPFSEMHPFEKNRSYQRSTHQQAERGQENGLPNPMASGVTPDETFFFSQEVNLPPYLTEVREERHLLDPCEGDEALVVSYPIQEENPLSDQLTETPQQPTYHQEDCALHNGLSSPTQETAVHDASPPPPPDTGYPAQEREQDVRGSYLMQGSSELRLRSGHDDRPRCVQQTNHYQVNGVSSLGENEQAIEHNCDMQELRLWENEIARAKPQKATKKMNAREAFYITEITEVRQHRHVDSNGGTTAVFTCPIITDRYGYKLGLRMYLNGVGNGRGRHVAIFMHMMMGKYDNFEVGWPFTQKITLSIIDQSGAQRHLSRILQAKPNMVAFEKPTQAISRMGCGFVNFAPIEEVFSHPYVKDDNLFLKIEFSA
ncbi:uncharacterized protein LOC111342198 [Stylophora pistillata]|uniref:uncharacterized protein LOC111342198 n=1 Tax=Stylophora pistillata TaxID=50429 RepID=UPI000C03E4B9|nr:uncharacterized protein LOC111342198 [Stylophora pistillata]